MGEEWESHSVSEVAVCVALFASWAIAAAYLVSFMTRREVADYYELQVSKNAHPAGKGRNVQIRKN